MWFTENVKGRGKWRCLGFSAKGKKGRFMNDAKRHDGEEKQAKM